MVWFITFVIGLIGGAATTLGVVWDRVEKGRKALERAEQTRAATQQILAEANAKQEMLTRREFDLSNLVAEFQRRVISYEEFKRENATLKRDLQNIDINLNKRLMDNELLHQQQIVIDQRSTALALKFLADTTKWISNSLNPNNYAAAKERLTDAIDRCREIGFNIPADEEARRHDELRAEFERVVRIAVQREEQARIKAQIREEERLQREAERAIEQAKRESDLIETALNRALVEANGQHNEEVERLKARLAEAEAKSVRALSMAQQTKAGNIYVISNPGSFGEGVFKIGMTRRLEPMDRVRELGDASVPFSFDVHMMIACTDAPKLENALHRALHRNRLNKVNPRKEFFRSDIDTIVSVVRANHGNVEYIADAAAFEYRESLTMKDEDADYIEQVFEEAEGEKEAVVED